MIELKKVFSGHLFPFLLIAITFFNLHAKTYYVDSARGNDNANGLTADTPWKSIAKVSKFNFMPGDSILFKCGSIWREELIVSSSGRPDSNITYSSYGEGDKPKILGSEKLVDWEKYEQNIWKTKISQAGKWIWFVENDSIVWGSKKSNIEMLETEYDFAIDTAYVYVFSASNPSSKYGSVELSVRNFGIISGWYGKAKKYIRIENLEISFTGDAGIRVIGGKNWIVENCISHHNGGTDESNGQGIQYEGEDGLFKGNILFENGQHGFYLSAFGNAKVAANIIESNIVYNNYHTGIDIMNNGDTLHPLRKTVIRYNKVYDDQNFSGKEVGIQLYAFNGGKIKDAWIYYNLLYDNKGIGISIQDNCDSVFVYNNTVYQPESTCFTLENDSGFAELLNNIGVGDNYYAVLFIHNSANKRIDYNCWFRNEGNLIWLEGNYFEDLGRFTLQTDFEKHGINLNPELNIKTFKLKKTSPCIDKGKNVGLKKDWWGNNILEGKIDIGACECF